MKSWLRSGLGQMALSAFFFSIMSLLVRVAGTRLPSAQIVLARAAISLVITWVWLWKAGLSPWGNNRKMLVLRGLFGFCGLNCFYWGLVHMPLAEATVFQYMNPVFTALLAALVLNESIRLRELISVGLSLMGVILVARPGFLFGPGPTESLPATAVAISLAGAVFSAAAYVTVRKTSQSEHPLVVVLWFPIVATPLSIPAAVVAWVPPTGTEWLVLLGVGVSTQIAQVFMTRGLLLEPAGRATAMSYLQVIFAALWGVGLLHEQPLLTTWLGSALIGAGLVVLAQRRVRR